MKVFVQSYQQKRPVTFKVPLDEGSKRILTDQEMSTLEKVPDGTTQTTIIEGKKVDMIKEKNGVNFTIYADGGEIRGFVPFKELRSARA